MKKIQILDIKSTKDNTSVVNQLSKKELEKTIGGACEIMKNQPWAV